MFERFTDRARRVVVLAQEEARCLNHNYIGCEHLLLGLVHEGGGVAAQALKALAIRDADVRDMVQEVVGVGQQPPTGHIPFTPRSKKILELSLREALQLGHNYIGTEHILLGLLRESGGVDGGGVAADVLIKLAGSLSRVRQHVISILASYGENTTTLDERWERFVKACGYVVVCTYCSCFITPNADSREAAIGHARESGARIVNDTALACVDCLQRPLGDFVTAPAAAVVVNVVGGGGGVSK